MSQKVALITGAGTGLGKGTAFRFARDGYAVGVHYSSSAASAEEVCEEIKKEGGFAVPIQANLEHPDGHRVLFEGFDKAFGRLDVYINNAGFTGNAPIEIMPELLFDKIWNINYRSAVFCVKHAAERMVEKGIAGSIITVTSNQSSVITVSNSCYGTMKMGLSNFTRHAALQFAPYGIRVNEIAPGIHANYQPRQAGKYEEGHKRIPLKAWGTPEQFGAACAYICSEEAGFITGALLLLNGGSDLVKGKLEEYGL